MGSGMKYTQNLSSSSTINSTMHCGIALNLLSLYHISIILNLMRDYLLACLPACSDIALKSGGGGGGGGGVRNEIHPNFEFKFDNKQYNALWQGRNQWGQLPPSPDTQKPEGRQKNGKGKKGSKKGKRRKEKGEEKKYGKRKRRKEKEKEKRNGKERREKGRIV